MLQVFTSDFQLKKAHFRDILAAVVLKTNVDHNIQSILQEASFLTFVSKSCTIIMWWYLFCSYIGQASESDMLVEVLNSYDLLGVIPKGETDIFGDFFDQLSCERILR